MAFKLDIPADQSYSGVAMPGALVVPHHYIVPVNGPATICCQLFDGAGSRVGGANGMLMSFQIDVFDHAKPLKAQALATLRKHSLFANAVEVPDP